MQSQIELHETLTQKNPKTQHDPSWPWHWSWVRSTHKPLLGAMAGQLTGHIKEATLRVRDGSVLKSISSLLQNRGLAPSAHLRQLTTTCNLSPRGTQPLTCLGTELICTSVPPPPIVKACV